MKLALSASIVVNVALCTALVCLVTFGSSNVGAPVASRTMSFSRAMTPAPTFRSAIAQAYCEEVVDPANNKRYETMSYMPDFNERDQEAQINYMIQNGLIPCVEFDNRGDIHRENSRMPGQYDGRYWTMWKLPMFGATDARSVMQEVSECKRFNPKAYIRILGFDNIKQVQCMGFLVSKPGQSGSYSGGYSSSSRPAAPAYGSSPSYGSAQPSYGGSSGSYGSSSSFGSSKPSGGFGGGKWTRPVE